MGDALPYVAAASLVVIVWVAGLSLLDAFTTDDVRAWRRLAGLRGYMTLRSRFARVAGHSRPLRRLQQELDLERLLATAQRTTTPLGFLAQTVALSLGAFSALMLVDGVAWAASGAWPLAPWMPALLATSLLPLSLLELRGAARAMRERHGATVMDASMMLAVLTDSRGFQLDDSMRILCRCCNVQLSALLDGGYRRLVAGPVHNTVDLYRRIGDAYGIPELRYLADAAAASNTGMPEREVYTRLALSLYQERLAGARIRSARARVLVTLPVAAMLIPLLLLIGAPTLSALSGGL